MNKSRCVFLSRNVFDVYFERDYEDEHNVKKQISIEEKTIDSVSKSLYLTVAKSTLLNDSVYDSNLFGTISGEGIEECSNLWEIRNSLPKILFLSGTGGSGKQRILENFNMMHLKVILTRITKIHFSFLYILLCHIRAAMRP